MKKLLSRTLLLSLVFAVATAHEATQAKGSYAYATNGVVDKIAGRPGGWWKVILDESNLGGKELELVELILPAGSTIESHTHKSIEIVYVLSGTYGHEVNGHYYLLKPGMVGVVRPGDHVRHIVPKGEDARLLIFWAPGGEIPFDHSQGRAIKILPEAK